ncbi:N-acetylmuramic acid 6-phosphate etherase [Mangrovibacterium marinum]|uniref:N-acetylmuramic acid 6-phosphate etherase n=1 Tax=Mangrovibacterium marinum TaxID=1639118 RepID=A0A2T5C2J8_9BACT|nr:N-acetylmuramic acid 6-phosphate etherase [Mangrovibacterium marinum]PTN08970.1 N-acetylmuramic acid 6-phosphate etherase [Mangrovibacterium marinum]
MSKQSVTESESLYDRLEEMTVRQLLENIHEEDKKVLPAVQRAIPQIERLVEQIVERVKKGGRLFYIGAGTSGRLGILDASEIPPTYGVNDNLVIGLIAGGDQAIRKAVESAEDNPELGWRDLQACKVNQLDTVIGIAASGRTPYVVGAITKASENGILTGCITNNPESPLAQSADLPIEAIVGPEFVSGSTRMKSGTSQKLILNMITTTLMIKLGRVKGNRMVNMQLTNQKLIERGTRMIMAELGIDEAKARQLLLQHGSVDRVLKLHR